MYPVGSDARWFVVSLFLIGVTLFITALSVTLGPIVEGRMKGVMSLVKRFQRMSNHVVVCGWSGVAQSVVDELRDRGVPVVTIDDRERIVQLLRAKGHDVLEGDPTLGVDQVISPSNLGGRLLASRAVESADGGAGPSDGS